MLKIFYTRGIKMEGQIKFCVKIKDFRKMTENTNYNGMWILVDWIDNVLSKRLPFGYEGNFNDNTWLKLEINKGRTDYFIADEYSDEDDDWVEAGSERLRYWPVHELFELIHGLNYHRYLIKGVEYK